MGEIFFYFFGFHGIQFFGLWIRKKFLWKIRNDGEHLTKSFLSIPKMKCFAIHFPTFQSKQTIIIYSFLGGVGVWGGGFDSSKLLKG